MRKRAPVGGWSSWAARRGRRATAGTSGEAHGGPWLGKRSPLSTPTRVQGAEDVHQPPLSPLSMEPPSLLWTPVRLRGCSALRTSPAITEPSRSWNTSESREVDEGKSTPHPPTGWPWVGQSPVPWDEESGLGWGGGGKDWRGWSQSIVAQVPDPATQATHTGGNS